MKHFRNIDHRHGIALIIVLGFLSILILLAVTMAVSMRTEKTASQYHREGMQARQFLRGAVASAIEDINERLVNDNPGAGPVSNPQNIHPPKVWAIMMSEDVYSGLPVTNLDAGVQLISGEVTNWLPQRYMTSTDFDYDAIGREAEPEWIFVTDPIADANSDNPVLGRFAYMSFDCTGLIDANLLAANPVRSNGVDISEIDIESLPEIAVDGAGAMWTNLDFYHRFATLPEMRRLNDGNDSLPSFDETQSVVEPRLVNNLAPYSLSYDRGWWNWFTSAWRKDGAYAPNSEDVTSWGWNDVNTIFNLMGYVPSSVTIANCWSNYVDADSVPSLIEVAAGSTAPCCEAVPMVNQISAREELETDGVNITYRHFLVVELWYPFPANPNPNTYRLTVNNADFNIRWQREADSAISTFNMMDAGARSPPDFTVNPGVPFTNVTVVFEHVQTAAGVATDMVRATTLAISNLNITVEDRTTPGLGFPFRVDIVDSLNKPLTYPMTPWLQVGSAGASVRRDPWLWDSLHVNDPRVNNEDAQWRDTSTADASVGSVNSGWVNPSTGKQFNESTNGNLEGTALYVRNSPDLESVAELGLLHTGDPWTTIDMFSRVGWELLLEFRTNALGGGLPPEYSRGLINPNTTYPDVLAAVFTNVPLQEYPSQVGATLLTDPTNIQHIVTNMLATTYDNNATGEKSYYSGTEWVTNSAFSPQGPLATQGQQLNNNQIEGIIRNTHRLFNANQNLLTIVVTAQTINDNPDGTGARGTWGAEDVITGERRAVVVVWRDPYPNKDGPSPTGRHEMQIVAFRYLDN